jgi:hypothetical protein
MNKMSNDTQAESTHNDNASVDDPARLLAWQKIWDKLLEGISDQNDLSSYNEPNHQ